MSFDFEYTNWSKRKNILILHSYHYPIEDYARDVALEIKKMNLPGIKVIKSPRRKRWFEQLLRKYDAKWALDLHSDPYRSEPDPYLLHSDVLGNITYGGITLWNPDTLSKEKAERWHLYGILSELGELLWQFQIEKYGKQVLSLNPNYRGKIHRRMLQIGLLWFRPMDKSVEFIKSLAQYLQERT
jgi:hypothetical protein